MLAQAVAAYFAAGLARLRLNMVRGRRAEVGDLFSEGEVFVPSAICTAIFVLVTAVPANLCFALAQTLMPDPAGPGGAVPVGFFVLAGLSLVLLIGQIVAMVLLWPYQFLIVDHRAPGVTSLSASLEATKGSRLQLFALLIVQGIIGVAASIPCLLGWFLAGPYLLALNVAAYEQIAGNVSGGDFEQ